MTKRHYGHPNAGLAERTAKAVVEGRPSVEVGACVGPRYRGVAYQAVQPVRCARCHGTILPGCLFTRRALRWGIGLHPICVHCAPVELAGEGRYGGEET